MKADEKVTLENGGTDYSEYDEITLNVTNNPWINNGLIVFCKILMEWFEDEVDEKPNEDCVFLSGRVEEV